MGEPAVAVCRRDRFLAGGTPDNERHGSPLAGCDCGIYGAKQPLDAQQYFVASWAEVDTLRPPPLPDDFVPRAVGLVSLWGRVLDCSQGYRASHAYPARIWFPARRPDGRSYDVEAAALDLTDYRVPVEILDVGTRAEIAAGLRDEEAA